MLVGILQLEEMRPSTGLAVQGLRLSNATLQPGRPVINNDSIVGFAHSQA